MIPYLLCFIPSAVIYLFSKHRFENNKKAIFWMLLPLFVLVAFRGASVGADTLAYNRMYVSMHTGEFGFELSYKRLEIGYKLFLYILTRISANPQFQYICLAVFFQVVFVSFLSKNAENPSGFVVLFLGLNLFNFYITGVRQSIAMAICLLAYENVKKKQLARFIIVVLIACLFHKSALFFLLAYVFANIKPKKIHIPIYISGFVAVAFCNEYLFKIGGDIFDIAYGIEKTDNGYLMFFIIAIVTVFSFLKMDRLIKRNNYNRILIQLNAITMTMWTLRLFSRTAERPGLFFMPFTLLLIVQLIEVIDDVRIRQLVKLFSIAFLGLYFIYRLNGLGLIPYKFCWQ